MESSGQAVAGRLMSLDGLRAVAILAVVAFHFSRVTVIPDVYPSTSAIEPLTVFGRYGVHLFFVISGFVVFLTLERCRSRAEFLLRRFARLWPALIAATLLGMVVVALLAPGTALQTPPSGLAASMTTIDPYVWHRLGWASVEWIDGSLWSLWVEVSFYVIAALVYFAKPGKFLRNLTIVAGAMLVLRVVLVIAASGGSQGAYDVFMMFGLLHFVWFFVFGAAMWNVYRSYDVRSSIRIAIIAIAAQALTSSVHDPRAAAEVSPLVNGLVVLVIAAIFCAALYVPWFSRVLCVRPLVRIGNASYSIYLIHQTLGLALVYAIITVTGIESPASYLAVAVSVMVMFACGFALQHFIESPVQRFLLARLVRPRTLLPVASPVTPSPDRIST